MAVVEPSAKTLGLRVFGLGAREEVSLLGGSWVVTNKEPEGAVVSVVALLGGSWVVVSKVICRATIVITYIRGLITTHEPPSTTGLTIPRSS